MMAENLLKNHVSKFSPVSDYESTTLRFTQSSNIFHAENDPDKYLFHGGFTSVTYRGFDFREKWH